MPPPHDQRRRSRPESGPEGRARRQDYPPGEQADTMTQGKNQLDVAILLNGLSVTIFPIFPVGARRGCRKNHRPDTNRYFTFDWVFWDSRGGSITVARVASSLRKLPDGFWRNEAGTGILAGG